MVKPFYNVIFGRSVTQIFFSGNMFFSDGKQTIHKVLAAFIVKNCHPRTSLIELHYKIDKYPKAFRLLNLGFH